MATAGTRSDAQAETIPTNPSVSISARPKVHRGLIGGSVAEPDQESRLGDVWTSFCLR